MTESKTTPAFKSNPDLSLVSALIGNGIVGYKSELNVKTRSIDYSPVYADQFYKLPFWVSVKLKLKRWMRL